MTFDIKTFNAIAKEGLDRFEPEHYTLNATEDPDGVILRSQKLHDYEFSKNVKGIARAGAGTNNVPVAKCTEQGIVVFNTPGANANAVKELVIAILLLSVRLIIQGVEWVQKVVGSDAEEQVEAGKKQFAGTELEGKKLGVIGLGAIGAMVANDAYRLGMNVTGYDPFVSVDTAWSISRRVKRAVSMEEILETCDFITVHVPLNEKTRHLIGPDQFLLMKNTAVLLNFARGELVDTQAVIKAVAEQKIAGYVTDFADERLLRKENILVLPHLGASTEEAEVNCAKMAARTLKLFLETGNIKRSVNFPTVEMVFKTPYRISVIHKNVPNMLGTISSSVATHGFNIDNMINRSRDEYAYTLLDLSDITKEDAEKAAKDLEQIANVVRVRVISNLEQGVAEWS